MTRKKLAEVAPPTVWPRADPAALAKFDPRTKVCTMNCGQALGDPRSSAECKLLCEDCLPLPTLTPGERVLVPYEGIYRGPNPKILGDLLIEFPDTGIWSYDPRDVRRKL